MGTFCSDRGRIKKEEDVATMTALFQGLPWSIWLGAEQNGVKQGMNKEEDDDSLKIIL